MKKLLQTFCTPASLLALVLLGCRGGNGGSGVSGEEPAPFSDSAAGIEIQAPSTIAPGVYRVDFSLKDPSSQTYSHPRLDYSEDGGESFHTAAIVGGDSGDFPSSSQGEPYFLEWSASADLGPVDASEIVLRVTLDGESGSTAQGHSAPADLAMAAEVEAFRSALFPEFADILDHASPYYAKVLPSMTQVDLGNGIVRTDFVFDSPSFPESGQASNLCPSCPPWKKDVWTDLAGSIYVAQGENPTDFFLVSPLNGTKTIWSADFPVLFPQFDDGSILGAGDPSQEAAGSIEESIYKIVRDYHVGVVWGCFMQAASNVPGSAPGLTILAFDEASSTGEPRWNVFVSMAEATMRAITAVEIVRGAAPGSLRFAVHGSSKCGFAGSFAAAVDDRIRGAHLINSGEIGNWELSGELALAYYNPTIQTAWQIASLAVLGAGYSMHEPFDHALLAGVSDLSEGSIWAEHFDIVRHVQIGAMQGKEFWIESATADHLMDLRMREGWFDGELERWYPQAQLRWHTGGNGDHSNACPQAIKNLRSFAAVFLGRPRALSHLVHEILAPNQIRFTAQVTNPDPGKIEIAAVRLYVGYDDDNDFRYLDLPSSSFGHGSFCTNLQGEGPLVCWETGKLFPNRNFVTLDLLPTGELGEYEYALTVDPSAFGPAEDRFLAFFAEVEDRSASGAFPTITGEDRCFTSSSLIFLEKP